MNNAFPFVEAGGKETNGSLMGLMRLGSTVGSRWGRWCSPSSCQQGHQQKRLLWSGRGGARGGVSLELLLSLPSVSKSLLESKIGCVISF